jgi:membrane protease YdiL (CAAX protease family)
VNSVTGSSVTAVENPPVVGPRFRRSRVVLSALIVAAFVALAGGLLATRSRLESLSFPEASLALVVGRTMDTRFLVERQPRWERWISELLMDDDPKTELAESIDWYEEMARHARDAGVELQLAILEGEAGRRDRLREKLDAWDVRPDPFPLMASMVSAAYLPGAADVSEDAVEQLPGDSYPWFGEQLALRIALRRGDQAAAAAIIDERLERTEALSRRVRALTAIEVGIIVATTVAVVLLLVRRRVRLASAQIPPVWSAGDGARVLLHGAALQVVLLAALYVVSELADSAVLNALTWPWSNVLFLPMLVLARQQLMRPAGLRFSDALGLSLDPGMRGRLVLISIALTGVGLLGDWMGSAFAARFGLTSHWTEWFDEDMVWGEGGDAAVGVLSAVVAAPFFEEVVFRGLLFATLRRRYGAVFSAFASALIFAVAHGYGWVGLLSVLWSGALWALSYERTRSLVPGMIAHAAVNLQASLSVMMLLR